MQMQEVSLAVWWVYCPAMIAYLCTELLHLCIDNTSLFSFSCFPISATIGVNLHFTPVHEPVLVRSQLGTMLVLKITFNYKRLPEVVIACDIFRWSERRSYFNDHFIISAKLQLSVLKQHCEIV